MKTINQYIVERLKLNKDSKIKYDPNFIEAYEEVLYDSSDASDEYEDESNWNSCERMIDKLNKNYDGFIWCKYDKLMNDPKKDYNIENISDDLNNLSNDIIGKGDAYNYEYVLKDGHLEVRMGFNGGHSTQYVYALNGENWNKLYDYYNGYLDEDDEFEDLSFLFEKGNIEMMKL